MGGYYLLAPDLFGVGGVVVGRSVYILRKM